MIIMEQFFDMGGYGAFVWPSYFLVIIALLVLGAASYRAKKKFERDLEKIEKLKK